MDVVVLRPSPGRKIGSVDIVDKFMVKWQYKVPKAPQPSSVADFWDILHSF